MKTSKKLLSVLLTIIMMFSIVFGGLTTAFAVTSGDPATTTITASPTSIVADGSSTSTITVQVNDGSGDPVTTGGDTVTLSVYDGTSQTPLTVTDDTYGTYTATYTSSTTEGTATISGTLNGTAITSTATINQDTTAPAAPVVNNAGYINSTNQAAYAITGTGEVGATVNVTVIDSVTAAVYAPSVTVDTYGGFIATVDTSTLAEGTISITATQTDAAGNVSSEATVGVTKDTTVPVIAMLGITPMNVAIGDAYTDAGATASDDVDGGITASIVTNGTVNTATLGIYTITYNVSDAAGNPATAVTKTVNVIPAAPSVTADDVNNVIVDADATMEYSIDTGVTWTLYDDTVATPTFPGVVTVEVRVAANAGTGTPAGASTTLTFTAVGDITGNNILLIGDYAFDLSGSAYDMNNFLIASQTAYSDPLDVTYHVYFRIGDAWYDIISDPDMLNQITDLTTINGDGLFNYMNMQ